MNLSITRAIGHDFSRFNRRVSTGVWVFVLLAFTVAMLAGFAASLGTFSGGLISGGIALGIGTVATPETARAIPVLPFTAGAHEHVEGPFATLTVTPTAAVQVLNPIDVPAYGYFRSIWIEVDGAGGAGGTLGADAPWNIIQNVALKDVGGGQIVNPMSGWDLYLVNLFAPGNGAFNNNLANYPFYVGTAPNPKFAIRVPVEITARDALGALANQNSAANYKLELSINSRAGMTSADFTTPPTLTIRCWYEGWTLPAAQSMRGEPQSQVPPLLGTGLIQSKVNVGTLAGAQTIKVTKMGNLLRNVIFVGRTAAGARSDACLPDVANFMWDGNNFLQASVRYMQAWAFEKLSGNVTWPTGVMLLPYAHGGVQSEGRLGNEGPDLWFATTQSTRFEVVGNVTTPGSIDVITSEIAPVEMTQPERYVTPNDTGRLMAPAQ